MKSHFFRIPAGLVALTLTLGAGAATVAPVFAQDAPAAQGNNRGGNRMGQMLLGLGLNDDQKAKIRQMRDDLKKKNEGVTDPKVRRDNARAAYANLDKILTPAQDAKFKAERAEMMAKYKASHPDAK